MSIAYKRWFAAAVLGASLTGCATTQDPSEKLTSLEQEYQTLEQKGFVNEYAPVALQEANEAIERVRDAEERGAESDLIAHYQYLAQKKLDIALAKAKHQQALAVIENSDLRRKEVMLSAKEREANQAMATAEAMRLQAEMANQEAAAARREAKEMSQKANELAGTLRDLSAKETDRGLVLTMGNILFELDKASLKSGTERTLERVAEFLKQYPDREVLVEGYTDSTGPEQYNQELSQERAKAVADKLAEYGVQDARLKTKGYGEEYPVANNDTKAGRQQNRRVELVVSNSTDAAVTARD